MTAPITAGINPVNIHNELWHIPMNLAAGITQAHIGRAVTLDATAPNTVKLAGDGDPILGRLETVEHRQVEGILVGTVAMQGVLHLPYDGTPSPAITPGAALVGAGNGFVKVDTAAPSGAAPYRLATAVDTDRKLVTTILL
jgi:hypothetical protein